MNNAANEPRTQYVIRERVALSQLHQEKLTSLSWRSTPSRINSNSPLFGMGLVERYTVTGPRGRVRRFHRLTAAGRVVVNRIHDEAEGVDGAGRHIILVDTLPDGVNDGDRCDDFGRPLLSMMSLDELEQRADDLNGHGVERYAGERAAVMKEYDDRRAFNRAERAAFDRLASDHVDRNATEVSPPTAWRNAVRAIVPILLAVVAMVSTACTGPSTGPLAARSMAGQWIGQAGPFARLRLVLGANDDGTVYGTAYADLADCHSDRALDCHLMGDVAPGSRVDPAGGVALVLAFPAYHFDATVTGTVDRDGTIAGTLTEQVAGRTSAPVAITIERTTP
jgi:hypothetical protein